MVSAYERVLGTAELLEIILLQLNPFDELLSAQLVCSSFNKAIQSSPRLQQALFLKAKPSNIQKGLVTAELNPLLLDHILGWFVIKERRKSMKTDHVYVRNRNSSDKEAFLRAEASWRRMLAVQPPATRLEIVSSWGGMRDSSRSKATILFDDDATSEEGVTMGAIYDLTEEHLSRDVNTSFKFLVRDSDTGPRIILKLDRWNTCVRRGFDTAPKNLGSQGANQRWRLKGLEWKRDDDFGRQKEVDDEDLYG